MLVDQKNAQSLLNNFVGKFIVFEGGNGSGKSSVINALSQKINEKTPQCVLTTREPGGTNVGTQIRTLLLNPEFSSQLVSRAEMFLFAADRAVHVDTIIKPALARGQMVFSDRYYFSTICFQSFGKGVERGLVDQINSIAIDNTQPDLVILLDVDPVTGLSRTTKRNSDSVDSYEQEKIEFHQKVRDAYNVIAHESKVPFYTVDANKDFDSVLKDMFTLFQLN
jgi:dTMP kinase